MMRQEHEHAHLLLTTACHISDGNHVVFPSLHATLRLNTFTGL